jgi:hypothetical protein
MKKPEGDNFHPTTTFCLALDIRLDVHQKPPISMHTTRNSFGNNFKKIYGL